MNYLKKKAMLDTAALVIGCIGVTAAINVVAIYAATLPFTAMDYLGAFMFLVFVGMIRLAYKMRLDELERRARYAEKFLEKKGLL